MNTFLRSFAKGAIPRRMIGVALVAAVVPLAHSSGLTRSRIGSNPGSTNQTSAARGGTAVSYEVSVNCCQEYGGYHHTYTVASLPGTGFDPGHAGRFGGTGTATYCDTEESIRGRLYDSGQLKFHAVYHACYDNYSWKAVTHRTGPTTFMGRGRDNKGNKFSHVDVSFATACREPDMTGSDPDVAAILLDGAPSDEHGGSYYPIPVAHPDTSIPTAASYCPVGPDGQTTSFPLGLRDSISRWSESSQADANPGSFGTVCTRWDVWRHCLTGSLAAAGVVIFPYSYAGAGFDKLPRGGRSGEFAVNQYSASDSAGGVPSHQLALLAAEINSIHREWPTTKIGLIGHSYGGLLAELYWQCQSRLGQLFTRVGCPKHVQGSGVVTTEISLDSPVNGVARSGGFLTGQYSDDIKGLWQDSWDSRGKRGKRIASSDKAGRYIAVGTYDDGTYNNLPTDGNTPGMESQIPVTCNGDSSNPCYTKKPPSFKEGKDPMSNTIVHGCSADQSQQGVSGHDTPKACHAVIRLILRRLNRS